MNKTTRSPQKQHTTTERLTHCETLFGQHEITTAVAGLVKVVDSESGSTENNLLH
jgi:hypothetical protein